VEGNVYRLLYLDGILLDAVMRRPSVVIGDGHSSIRVLLNRENQRRLQAGPTLAYALVTTGLEMRSTLAEQGFSLASVPKAGTRIKLKRVVNENSAEDNIAAGEFLCRGIVEEGAAASAAIGVRLAGIDIITPDPSVPLAQAGGVILEINTSPAFHHHYHRQGPPFPVAKHLLPILLRNSCGNRESGEFVVRGLEK
jgi:D-alanine-D-alanine ligase-like ATP-grasp enzyme